MPDFDGYYLIDAGNGVFASVSIFDTEAHAEESTRIASAWVRDEKLERERALLFCAGGRYLTG